MPLELPGRQRLPRFVELGLPTFGAVSNFWIAATGAVGFTSPVPSMFWILVLAYFGSGVSGQSVTVSRGVFSINNIIRSSVVRNAIIERVVAPGPGNVVLVLRGHEDIVLRWSPFGARYWRSHGQRMPEEILQAYGGTEAREADSLTIEHSWIRWRIIYWTIVAVLSPVPFLLGLSVASLLSGDSSM